MHSSPIDVDKQATSIFYPVNPAVSFHDYMTLHQLLWSDVAPVADVPLLVVWSIDHLLAVSAEHANMVRAALEKITGVPFTGSIHTTQ